MLAPGSLVTTIYDDPKSIVVWDQPRERRLETRVVRGVMPDDVGFVISVEDVSDGDGLTILTILSMVVRSRVVWGRSFEFKVVSTV